MPNQHTHDLLTVASTPAAYWIGSLLLPEAAVLAGLVATGVHIASGVWLSPDLDVTTSRWGPLCWLWWPYMLLVPHRSWLSHSLLLGPLLRVLYLALMLGGLGYGLLWLMGTPDAWCPWYDLARVLLHPYADYSSAAIAGLVTGSAAHVLPDLLSTAVKRRV